MVNAHLSLLSSGFRIKQTGCFLIGCRSPPFRLNFENSDGTEEIGVKRDPSAVFIKTKDGYAELTYEEYCRYCKGNPSYQNRRFLFLHGMLMEVSEQDYMAFYRDKSVFFDPLIFAGIIVKTPFWHNRYSSNPSTYKSMLYAAPFFASFFDEEISSK